MIEEVHDVYCAFSAFMDPKKIKNGVSSVSSISKFNHSQSSSNKCFFLKISNQFDYMLETHGSGKLLLTDYNNLIHVLSLSAGTQKSSLENWSLVIQSIPHEAKEPPETENVLLIC